jgi:hypothetical protein
MRDCVGNEIHEGAILKVYHFTGSKKRKHFMYKQVGKIVNEKNNLREIKHLPIGKDGGYYKKDDTVLLDSVVVQCSCEFHIYNNLKLSKFHGA